jgi:hypothetical protein
MKTKEFKDKISDYIYLILIMSSTIGAGIQFFELGSISISLLRFFSATQFVIDGSFILLILFFLFGGSLLLIYSIKKLMSEFDSLTYILQNVSFILLTLLGFFLIKYSFLYNIIYTLLIITVFVIYYNYSKFNEIGKKITITIFYTMLIFSIGALYPKMKELMILPENIINTLDYTKNNLEIKNIKLLYFNDKYVFLEVTINKQKVIKIEKFDDYFFSQPN